MRRAVGFTFIGEGKSHGNKITAPFRVSEVSEGTEAAKKLLVGDEIVQVDGLRGISGTLLTLYSLLSFFQHPRASPCAASSLTCSGCRTMRRHRCLCAQVRA